ncbi:hypothetical protein [Kitasatospora purpeofusca]|uniref:hypothetical protein n=1 Tax=Kitasatospora purpeofusca TaxID=67352 RepID=UPI002255BFE1|nr:hypothetical protein [Kitasatospora purpeofusca]MCX4755157.1 hypothetical protein [Kitasatospora purpeofusca]WSR36954.1 hypothetical protein OG715_41915 [Kitasatospora purpeofusca]
MPTGPIRTPASYVLGGAVAVSLVFAATPATAEDLWTPVAVENSDFASPLVASATSPTATAPTGWYGANPTRLQVFSAALANHPRRLQAVSLNSGGPGKLRQRLWNVNAGAQVRVRFSDSASTLGSCSPAEVAGGQKYRVSAYRETAYDAAGEPVRAAGEIVRTVQYTQDYTTLGYTKAADTVGSGAWSPAPKVFEFTAAEDNPLVVFESLEDNPPPDANCGPLLTAVSAEEQAAFVDHRIEQNKLPWSAYNGIDEISLASAAQNCRAAANACRFTADPRYSYQFYGSNRILDYAYLNCTRNQVVDRRTVTWAEEGFDSISQEAGRIRNANSTDQNPANTGEDDAGMPSANPNMFKQVAAGFQRNEGNPNLANTTNPLIASRSTSKQVEQDVQPGEASWIEVQPARERIEGLFRSTNGITIDAMFDFPSGKVPDRLYERTGPLTQDEKKHCLTERPLKVTPDNGGTRSLSSAGPLREASLGDGPLGGGPPPADLLRAPVSAQNRDTRLTELPSTRP